MDVTISKVNVGEKLPDFELPNQNGELVSLSSLKGQKFIMFFYPKDDSPGCTNDFGFWGPKKFMGREIIGVYRTTILVDENGVVEEIISKVKTKIHGEQILEVMS